LVYSAQDHDLKNNLSYGKEKEGSKEEEGKEIVFTLTTAKNPLWRVFCCLPLALREKLKLGTLTGTHVFKPFWQFVYTEDVR
jgi:hypothetical protein